VLVPMLGHFQNYVPFLIFSTIVTLLGAMALFLLGRYPTLDRESLT
jgi:hypothetical protein